MRFNIPILFPAASIPLVFLSRPSTARFKVVVSASREVENALDDSLSWVARERREAVRSVCVDVDVSRSWVVDGADVELWDDPVAVAWAFGDVVVLLKRRLRRTEVDSAG